MGVFLPANLAAANIEHKYSGGCNVGGGKKRIVS